MNLLTAEQLTKAYGERKIFDEADFSIQEGEKIGIIGVNGTGKSTLLKILAGQEECDDGQITMGNNLKIAYLPQTPVFAQGDTVLEAALKGNVSTSADDRWTREAEAKSMLNELDLTDFDQPVEQLSGGQKKRAALVRVLMSEGDILILDEPTNHLDHEMSQWLENYLLKFRGAIVLVTHDRYFLDRVVRRIFAFEGGGQVRQYEGGYSDYDAVRTREGRNPEDSDSVGGKNSRTGAIDGVDQAETGNSEAASKRPPREKKLKLSYKEEREAAVIDDEIAALEEKIQDLEAQIASNASNFVKLNELMAQKAQAEEALEQKMDRWVYLNDLMEQIARERAEKKG